jgi:menaquinol-cytochrome c reductase iron-sulfur subunit
MHIDEASLTAYRRRHLCLRLLRYIAAGNPFHRRHDYLLSKASSSRTPQIEIEVVQMSNDRQTTTRGGFISVATVGIGAAIGGAIAVPAVGYALASSTQEATFTAVSLGPAERFTPQTGFSPVAAPYVEDATQPLISSGLAYVVNTGHSSGDWLAPDAMFVVFSNRCTHVGCPAQATDVGFACPCHGSVFDREGSRIAGPAVRPLDRFQWEVRADGNLWITQRWSVLIEAGKVRYFPVKSPGQPLAGEVPSLVADLAYPAVTYRHGPLPATDGAS